jgi:hypothetical protein
MSNSDWAAPAAPEAPRRTIIVRSEQLVAKVRELIHQGNVRRIVVMGENGATILEIPLTAGVIGAIVAPVLVAIGAIAALAQKYTLLIEATHEAEPAPSGADAGKEPQHAKAG